VAEADPTAVAAEVRTLAAAPVVARLTAVALAAALTPADTLAADIADPRAVDSRAAAIPAAVNRDPTEEAATAHRAV